MSLAQELQLSQKKAASLAEEKEKLATEIAALRNLEVSI